MTAMDPINSIETFDVVRGKDAEGRSRVVAQAVRLGNGKAIIAWKGEHHSVAVYDSLEDLIAIHGHGETEIFSTAKLDFATIDALRMNMIQDEFEGVGCGFPHGTNAGYMWEQRAKALALLDRVRVFPKTTV